jgi:hypothetical protein
MHRRKFVFGALGVSLTGSPVAWAAPVRPFDRNAFTAAQETGKPIVVFVHAPW